MNPSIVLDSSVTGLDFIDLLFAPSKGQIVVKAQDADRFVDLSLEGHVLKRKGTFKEDELQEIRDWIYLNEDALKAHWMNPSSSDLLEEIRKL